MKKHRGYLWVDWVELGCRGWDIDESGAERNPVACCPESDAAHLDRTTLHLLVMGCRRFVAATINDLIAAGLMFEKKHEPSAYAYHPLARLHLTDGTLTAGSGVQTINHSIELDGEWRIGPTLSNAAWTHPDGGVLRVEFKPAPSWSALFKKFWQDAIVAHVARMFAALTALDNRSKKAA